MKPIETDPVDPIGPINAINSGGRPRKPSGGAQAITMILAWVGGAAAAVAAAFWILQFVKPAQDPEPESNNRPAIAKNDDLKKKYPKPVKPERVKPNLKKTKVDSVRPTVAKPPSDLTNFQRPEKSGLRYSYYAGQSFVMTDFKTATPSRDGVTIDIADLPSAKEAKGLLLAGFWKTTTAQSCDFKLNSTNGARLWIDDQLVLDNTAQFQREPVNASRTIKSGVHKVAVEFILSTQGGSYKLEVGAIGDPKRFNLIELLEPFDPRGGQDALNRLRYDLAQPAKPMPEVSSLLAVTRNLVETGLIEHDTAPPAVTEQPSKIFLPPDGRLLAGMAVGNSLGKTKAIVPIYQTDTGRVLGELIGNKADQWSTIVAKPGFAVSAVQFGQSNEAIDVSLEFRRIGNDSLLPTDAYTQSIDRQPVSIAVSDSCQPVVGLRVHMDQNSRFEWIDVVRVRSAGDRILTILVDGFPAPPDHRKAPSPAVAKKELKKLMKESAARLQGKAGSAQLMELKALAESTAKDGRNSVSDENRFVSLLEARRLHLLAGNFESAFEIMNEISQNFEYDCWEDQLLFFGDAAKRAGKSASLQRKVAKGLSPVIIKAKDSFEFETAGRLAAGGKMLATALRDQKMFDQFSAQLEEFERSAATTKQARAAARMLINNPDDPKANRVLGIFSLMVTKDWDAAMKYFARSSSKDCEFIAEHDRSFDATDSETAIKLADCWKRIGKKNDEIEKLAVERAQKILIEAKTRAHGKALKDIEADLERL